MEIKKVPFDIDTVMKKAAEAVEPFPKAALFELAEDGYSSPFEQLIACIISIRTRDEDTLRLARQLFEKARTPEQMLTLTAAEIELLIGNSTFHERKAPQILAIAQQVSEHFNGQLPCDQETLMSFSGVGVKCANLVLSIACDQPRISVDVHVFRITNRWGYVAEKTPEKTTQALEEKLPKKYWVEINRVLVPFGKHICTGSVPWCSKCPLVHMCRQVGVTNFR